MHYEWVRLSYFVPFFIPTSKISVDCCPYSWNNMFVLIYPYSRCRDSFTWLSIYRFRVRISAGTNVFGKTFIHIYHSPPRTKWMPGNCWGNTSCRALGKNSTDAVTIFMIMVRYKFPTRISINLIDNVLVVVAVRIMMIMIKKL